MLTKTADMHPTPQWATGIAYDGDGLVAGKWLLHTHCRAAWIEIARKKMMANSDSVAGQSDRHPVRKSAFFRLALLVCLSLFLSLGGTPRADAAPPVVVLPNAGISSATNHPNLVLDLSVEFPTVGSAYIHQAYLPTTTYAGYFDPTRCYTYPVPTTYLNGSYDTANDANRYFVDAGAGDALHRCNGKFSGNFMNWASSSAIDILRLSMTGGDRVIDQVGRTILQRAVLPLMYRAAYDNFPPVVFSNSGGVTARDVTPFSVPTLYVTSCRNRVQFASTPTFMPIDIQKFDAGILCDQQIYPDKALGEFVARVEVCSNATGGGRPDLCQRYGTHYKPEGAIQKNANHMRFAAFGYLNDSDARRNGGVLRAPMQYVGPSRYNATLQPSANPNTEWNPATGVFVTDPMPDGAGTGISGVINYLNKFGRDGNYKIIDPVGELFYESIRYLQGLQPSPDTVANITPAMKDGFPVITQWTDPILGSCQKNSIVLIADGYTHHEFSIPGNTRLGYEHGPGTTVVDFPRPIDYTSSPPLDVMAFTHRVGVMETTTHGVDSTTRAQLANLDMQLTGDQQGGGFESSYYLAGLAYWANTSQLRTDGKTGISAQTYVIDVDEYGNGMPTDANPRRWTHPRDSQLYLAAKYGAFRPEQNPTVPHDPTDPFWPLPTASSPRSAAGCYGYLWDPAGSCDPPNYFLATDGARFSRVVKNIFADLEVAGEAVTQAGASSAVVTEGTKQYIYQGKFMTPGWVGDLRRVPVTYDPIGGLTIGAPGGETPTTALKEPDWPVPAPGPAIPPRNIFTYSGAATPTANSTIPFEWSALSPAQQAVLNGTDALGEARLHYLRGSTSDEQRAVGSSGQFRRRAASGGVSNVLGDIIHSNPVYVGAPAPGVQGVDYQAFYSANAARPAAVYVGANDGMLHAFDAGLTRELFAYIPSMIFQHLPALSDPAYRHRPYVDGGIAVAEAKVGNAWKTVLASSMGGGAQGVFALDVTNPQNFSGTSGALWEFSDTDDPDMGNIFGAPVIAKFIHSMTSGIPTHEYFVVVSSGVNNYAADGAVGSAPGGALFLLSLNKPAGVAWQRNVNYFKYPILNSAVNQSKLAGLSPPAVATNNAGAVTTVYAGDLQGQLWRFSFPPTGPMSATTAHRLFTARDAGGNPQPITTPPAIVFAPDGGHVVLLGTGKYLESTDVRSAVQDSMYGIYDTLAANYTVPGRSALALRTLSGGVGAAQLGLSGVNFGYSGPGAKAGWYFDFANAVSTGERVVTPPQLGFGQVIFNSLLPAPAFASCPAGSGGRSYAINTLTGLAGASGSTTGKLSNVGILSAPIIFSTRAAQETPAKPNAVGRKTVRQNYSIASVGGSGVAPAVNQQADQNAGRLSWREIFNYQGF